VWVTEFGLAEDLNKIDPAERRIFGHCAIDATGSRLHPPLVLHVPGFAYLWRQRDPGVYAQAQDELPDLYAIDDDHTYSGRFRR